MRSTPTPRKIVSAPSCARTVFGGRFRQRHADWMRPDQCELLVPIDREAVPLDPAFQGLVHGFQEIVAVRLNMEAEKIRTQQSIQEFPLPGTDPEGFRVGPRYVPEDCHPGIGSFRFYEPGQQREMVILDKHERLLRHFDFLQDDLREFLIYRSEEH